MSPEKEKLLSATYDKFMKVSMNKLPGELLEGITAENIMAYGTAIDERLLSIQDCRDLVERQLKQASGMKFKHERIPVSIIISPEEDSAIFVEELYLTIKSREDTHRLFLRITTALEYSDNKWKVVHFHTSKPDDTKGETDTWHIDEWKRKNEELQKLVDEKTTDLLIKNHDLEIEASLERVRTIAMSMRKSDDLLNICETLFNELKILGFDELRNTMINIHNDEEKTFINYDYSDTLGKTITPLFYNINPVISKQIKQIRKGKDAFSETSFKGDDLKEWKKFRKRKGEPDDPRLKDTKALYYYFYSIGTGSIGISTFGSITKGKLDLLKRFRNVFEFAYRRYMDVMQAEEQAKEAKLEASLERVRAQAMGINKSEQLGNISETVFTELKALGFADLRNAEIIINSDKKESVISYYYSDYGITETIEIFYNKHPKVKKWAEEMRKADDAFTSVEFGEHEIVAWRKYREEIGYLPDPKLNKAKAVYYYSYSIGPGALSISSFKKIGDEQLKILERFRNVFGLAYRRYADVALAEEQAKEAKLEASLERVRTHSMVMKKPDDLVKVCESLFNELKTLGFMNLRNSQIVVFNDDNKSFLNYDYSDYAGANTTTILNNSHPLIQSFLIKIKKSKEAFAEFSMELKDWKKFRKKNGELPDPKLDQAAFIYYYFYSIGAGAIGISAFASITKEELEILKRFRNVFEFAYGKYSDVTKAEAQTKEAKIETALERVRSRTMAMQKSEELSETTYILFQQFIDLGESPDQITIGIINEEEKAIEFWTTMDGNKVDMMVKFPVKDTDLMKKIYSAWKKQKKSIAIEIKGKELDDYIDYRIRLTGVSTKNDHVYDRRFVQAAFFSKGMITISTNDPRSKETLQLLERFAGVFDLTYTRFLDLKQAEAQTKEAKIELSLERVRARSMAMHSSNELVDASIVLFNELKSLGIESIRTGVGIFDESKKVVEIWSSQLIKEKRNKILGVVPFKAHPFFELNYKAWKRKEPYFFYEMAGKEVKKYYSIMSSVLSYPEKKEFNPKEIFYTFFFPEGSLNVVSQKNLTYDECNLMLRFAKVFGMIYRRFLDLQKAEAQAREAQIELALERVRARTMAMQRSEELEETSQILFQQFKELGEAPERITIGTINEPKRQIELWVTVEEYQNRMVKVSIDEPNVIHKIYTAWKRLKKSILIDLKGKELRDYIAYRKSFGNDHGIGEFLKDRMIVYVAFFSKGIISITTPELLPRESIQLLERFAGVFDLTYTRFLDLQKAEAQAREALVEVALERVRSRTMAMHKSEELAETAAVLFQQLSGLGIDALRLYIGIIDEESDEIEFWTTDYGGNQISSKYKANLFGSTTFKKMYNGWKERKKSFIVDPKGKELTEHLYYLKEIMNYPIRNRKSLSRRLQTIAYFSKGLIGVLSNNELPKESIIVLERFAGVFDLTYRRFLDLQTSEAQTKEAHIEVALERVRSRTMAMHSSDELQEAAILLFQQIKELGVDTGSCGYVIWENKNKNATVWMSSAEGGFQKSFKLPHTKSKIYKEIYSAKEEGKEFFVKEVRGTELKKHFDYLTTVPGIGEKIKQLRKARYKFPETITYNTSFFKQGYLSFHTHEQIPDAQDIFRRFANVFEQTYTRFLDLQKSEAQAREAQIEAALERVRSRSMGMQKSEELKDVIQVVLEQFVHLNINAEHAGFVMDYKSRDDYNIWVADPLGVPSEITIPYFDSVYYNRFNEAKVKGEDFFAVNLTFKEKNIFYKKLFKYVPGLSEDAKKFYFSCPGLAASTVLLENVCLYIENFSGRPYTDEENNTLMRFGKVFQQTYTRFLDLQKAEAQAKEAQIEAALERVRAKAMSMQHSDELDEVLAVLCEQFDVLGIFPMSTHITVLDIEHNKFTFRETGKFGDRSFGEQTVALDAMDTWKDMVKSWRKSEPYSINRLHFPKETLPKVWEVFHESFASMPESSRITPDDYPDGIYHTAGKHPFGYIGMNQIRKATEEEEQIVIKFASEFGRAYQRFLDLQKAEAQAREAQIELGLERVRARAMAMQNSDELKELIGTVFIELTKLDLVLTRCHIMIYDPKTNGSTWWMANSEAPVDPIGLYIKYHEHAPYLAYINAWQERNLIWQYILEGKDKKEWDDFLFRETELSQLPNFVKAGMIAPDRVYLSASFNNFGCLNLASLDPLSNEHSDILLRFGKVFDLTYTRFNDLQKAEAQAREAQIEAALEKVRGKAMAMHNSNDLTEAAGQVFTELNNLSIKPIRSGFVLLNKESRKAKLYPATSFDNKNTISFTGEFEFTGHPVYEKQYESWQKKEYYFPVLEGDLLKSYYKILAKGLSVPYKNFPTKNKKQFGTFLPFTEGFLFAWSDEPYSETEINILDRFKSILDLTIRRYLDLQKAEAQTREAQIEAGLERVRSRAMAMHKTDELLDAAELVYKELSALGITSMNVSYSFLDKEEKYASYYSVNPVDGKTVPFPFVFPHTETEVMRSILSSWKEQESFNVIDLNEKATLEHQTWAGEHIKTQITKNNINIPFSLEAFLDISPKTAVIYTFNFSKGYLFVIGEVLLTKMQEELLLRFTKVFEQAYIRFLDLQKAETQAREAKIEAALERARTQSMLMQHSKELNITSHVFHEQLQLLGIDSEFSFVWLPDEKKNEHLFWTAWSENKNGSFIIQSKSVIYPLDKKERYTAECFRAWESNESVHEYFVPPEEINNYLAVWSEILSGAEHLKPEFFKKGIYYCEAFIKYGCFGVELRRPLTDEEKKILLRFAIEFERAYTRFLDLQKAEAQTREAQIEASLERVRSKAMAMQKSDDLGVAVATIFEELDKLDLGTFRCGIGIIDKAKKSVDVWATAMSDGRKTVQVSGDESMDTHPLLKGAFDAWLRQEDFSYLLQGDDLKKYYEIQIESNFELPDSRLMLSGTDELKQYYYVAVFQAGGLFAFRESEFPDEAKNIIKRFADVINFTYTRFNDLKQAEAQAKEAQIEATLERVRASALIMRKPEDMFDVCKIISEQLVLLNVNEIRNTQTVILNDGKETYQNYEYFPDYSEKTFSEIDYNLHPKVTEFVNEIKKSSDAFFTTSFDGKELQEWRDYRKNTNQIPDAKLDAASSVHYYFFSIGPGALGISVYVPLNEDQISIFKRFRNVFELAYRRYIDIEQAEAQVREAQIEAALERVRSRTLAMQKSDELSETAAVVFKQLISLGIEPNRLYIGIIKDESGEIEFWITDEDGTRVSNQFSGNKNRNVSIQKMYDGWKSNQKSISIDMKGKELEEYFHHLSEELHVPFKQGLSQKRRVQSIAYFSHGFIGIASPEPLSEETTFLLERFAAVFNLTYARFNDLKVAEHNSEQAHIDLIKLQTEKKRAEDALTELRATQAQLIQSEKMASLGELTAGIAHEIQNPLNFVNNFSEVNTELIDELNEELSKGNFEDAVVIAKDIKENEEKIKHHGKRAEGIVKGMLQHSRSSSGVKEPVNINALADEYLRLAYHGLRAKDKTFNAKMETNFDESIGKINVIPQDIGRVILNLITNAFYAVDEKKKLLMINGYEPTVTVITKKEKNNVLITVKDNGNGIPQKVMDKIFQPFFTTKPTGQGTGLGLSMSYDIIKAHGGELNVETKEGEGAEFVIVLPLAEN